MINEFTDGRWQRQQYPGTGSYAGQNLGNGILEQYGFPRKLPMSSGPSVRSSVTSSLFGLLSHIPPSAAWSENISPSQRVSIGSFEKQRKVAQLIMSLRRLI